MSTKNELNLGLRHLVKDHGIPLRKLSEKLDISATECLDWWVDPKVAFSAGKIRNLVWSVGASDDDLVYRRISPSTVDTGILDFEDKINPKYLENAFSYTMSSKHIVEYIATRHGWFIAKAILYRLGVHPEYFRSTQNRISLLFFEDLLREYSNLGESSSQIGELSKYMYLATEFESSASNLPFKKCASYSEGFQLIEQGMSFYEENYDYKFEIYQNKVLIRSRPSRKLADAMNNPRYGSEELFKYRAEVFGNMIMLCGLPPVKSKTLKCLGMGDTESIYELEYPTCKFV